MELRDSIFNDICKLMTVDERIIMLTADHSAFGLNVLRETFPDRYINVGIAEQDMISVAAGLALDGMKPIVYSIINFTTFRCLEQINVDVSMMNLPIIILGVGAGFCYSTDGPTHHGVQDIGIMKMIPKLKIFNISDDVSANKSLTEAYNYNGPSYIRFDKGDYSSIKCTEYDGFRVIKTPVNGKLVISTGTLIHDIIAVTDTIKCGLIDVFRLKDLPNIFNTIEDIKEILLIEEHFIDGGLGTILLEELNKCGYYHIKIKRIGIENTHVFVYDSNRQNILEKHKLDIYNLKIAITEFSVNQK